MPAREHLKVYAGAVTGIARIVRPEPIWRIVADALPSCTVMNHIRAWIAGVWPTLKPVHPRIGPATPVISPQTWTGAWGAGPAPILSAWEIGDADGGSIENAARRAAPSRAATH